MIDVSIVDKLSREPEAGAALFGAQGLIENGDLLGHTFLRANKATASFSFKVANGIKATLVDTGVLQLEPLQARASVVISSGIHGDEVVPVEICNDLIKKICAGEIELQQRVLFIFGNPEALVENTRFCDQDLNRQFLSQFEEENDSKEQSRANRLKKAVADFYNESKLQRTHLDLHTTINDSKYPIFALVPVVDCHNPIATPLHTLLCNMGVDAVVHQDFYSSVFSSFSRQFFGASSTTIEIGAAKPFGRNDLSEYESIHSSLVDFLSYELKAANRSAEVFSVTRMFTPKCDDAAMLLDGPAVNFEQHSVGTTIAKDGNREFCVEHEDERLIFRRDWCVIGERSCVVVKPYHVHAL